MKIICPHCNKEEMTVYQALDIVNDIVHEKLQCHRCGYWAIHNSKNHKEEFEKSNYYTLEFSTVSGDKEKFIGTKEEIYKQIEDYEWLGFDGLKKENRLRMIAMCIDILKYGYTYEFKDNEYFNYEITVDNGLWIRVRYGIF